MCRIRTVQFSRFLNVRAPQKDLWDRKAKEWSSVNCANRMWRIAIDEVEEIAMENLEHYSPELEIQFVESKEGGRAAIISEQDGYDAARLLRRGLYRRLAPQLDGDFFVATPARDMFVALSGRPTEFVERVSERVAQDYQRLPYPITSEFFYVTMDGVAGRVRDLAA